MEQIKLSLKDISFIKGTVLKVCNSKMMVLVLGRDELLLKLVRKHYVANKLKCKWFLYSDVDLAENYSSYTMLVCGLSTH